MTPWRFTVLGYKAGFAQPWFLLGVIVAGLFGLIAVAVTIRRRKRVSKAVPKRLAAALAPGVSTILPVLQNSAYTMALMFFAVALAQPQCGESAEVAKRRGIDVVVALDASKSMYARDVTPSRIDRAKLELTSLLDSLKGDRVGLVVFAGDAFIQCPLTSDYSAAKLFLRAVDPETMPQGGTNIGSALLLARQVLENADRGAKDRVVVLISDGEDLTGDITQGIDSLKELGARVLAIGVGSEAGETIPVFNKSGDVVGYKKDENGVTVITHLDRAGLVHIASATGGEFFTSPKGVAMADVVKIIDTLQKSELESRVTLKYGEAFQPFLAVGLFFLVLGFLILPSWRRTALLATVLIASRAQAAGPLEKNHPEVELGTEAYEAQKFDEALTHYDAALKEQPSNPRIQYNRGLVLHKLGRNDEAKSAFQTALDLDRSGELAAKTHYNLGNVAAGSGDKQQAVKEYRAALKSDPGDALARHNLEVLLKNLPPPQPESSDGGRPDGGSQDAGRPDAGRDGGSGDGGSDGGRGDAGSDAGPGDGGPGDGGQGDGGQNQRGDGGSDGGSQSPDAGAPQPAEPKSLPDGGVDVSQKDAEKLLDTLKSNERNLQLWRFKQQSRKSDPHGKDW